MLCFVPPSSSNGFGFGAHLDSSESDVKGSSACGYLGVIANCPSIKMLGSGQFWYRDATIPLLDYFFSEMPKGQPGTCLNAFGSHTTLICFIKTVGKSQQ